MKKRLHIIVLVAGTFILGGTLPAQGRFDASIFAGLNMGQIDGDGDGHYNQPGLRAGVGTSIDLGSAWRPVLELAYTQKGSFIGDYNRSIRAGYVELVAMMSYNTFGDRLRLAAGVAPAVLVHAKVTDGGAIDRASTDNFTRFDLVPITLAARYVAGHHLGFELRWQTSMLSDTKENGSGTYRIFRSNTGTFHRLVTFGVSYTF